MTKKILVLSGPNLNLLGTREPEIYGHQTLEDIHQLLKTKAQNANAIATTFQSNAEFELINKIHDAKFVDAVDFILFNPGAFTHTSIALRDALLGVEIPFIELHLSNVFSREAFRHHSYLSDIAVGVMSGFGYQSYLLAMDFALSYQPKKSK